MKSLKETEVASGAVGAGLAVIIFFAQGPYESAWQYVAVVAPVAAATLFIVSRLVYRRFQRMRRALDRARNLYGLLLSVDVATTVVVRIINKKGDASMYRRSRIELVKDGIPIHKTTKSFIGSKNEIPGLPPMANIVEASNVSQAILSTGLQSLDPASADAGDIAFAYEWQYKLDPPLEGKGNYVEYEHTVLAPGAEAGAFSKEGSEINFSHTAVSSSVDCTLISCDDHRIEVLEYFYQDSLGNKSEMGAGEVPVLNAGGHTMSWKPTFRKGGLFVCRYRVSST